jgi:hypothetical protein
MLGKRTYRLLQTAEQDDIVIQFHAAHERDHFCHQINIDRYTAMLQELPPVDPDLAQQPIHESDAFEVRIAKLLVTEQRAIANAELVLKHTEAQLPDDAAMAAAVARIAAKITP